MSTLLLTVLKGIIGAIVNGILEMILKVSKNPKVIQNLILMCCSVLVKSTKTPFDDEALEKIKEALEVDKSGNPS